jgi:integrase
LARSRKRSRKVLLLTLGLCSGPEPFRGLRMPKENQPRHQVWRWQQMKRVLRAQGGPKTKEVIAAFHIALRTGMRLSEVLVAPQCLDAKRKVVCLPRSKTTGYDEVPVGRVAVKLLKRQPFVVDANEASTLFAKLCKQLLIEDLTFHDTRGTGLTLLAKKVDVFKLARISRHRDVRVLQRTYYRETSEEIARDL